MRYYNNKLIAEFMGGIPSSVPNLIRLPQTIGESSIFCVKGSEGLPSGTFKVERINELEYHTSWDWLMPVVDKIKILVMEDDSDELYNSEEWDNITHTLLQIEIKSVYQAVVEFIKWYNKKVSKMTDNRLIAEFMGHNLGLDGDGMGEPQCRIFEKGLGTKRIQDTYDTSWTWLMPVVDKIESLGYEFKLSNSDHSTETIIDFTLGGSKRDDTYDSVVEFIKWYNEQ